MKKGRSLCKKNYLYIGDKEKNIGWEYYEGKYYDVYSYEDRTRFVVQAIINKTSNFDLVFMAEEFYEHFYDPEETKNFERTKLIDKMLS